MLPCHFRADCVAALPPPHFFLSLMLFIFVDTFRYVFLHIVGFRYAMFREGLFSLRIFLSLSILR